MPAVDMRAKVPEGPPAGERARVAYTPRMPAIVRFEPSGRSVAVAEGTLLLDAARQAGLPVARACGAGGICGRCGLRVLQGGGSLAAETEPEIRTRRRNRVSEGLRLACRVAVRGDLVVTASYW